MDILTSKAGGILTIAFNRPEKKNAITAAMYQVMADAMREAESDAAVRVILFAGQPDVFTAGNDLEDFLRHPPASDDHPVFQFMQAIVHAGKPVVAAVSGAAVGVGTTMLLHCDLVYAADNARFSLPFAQLGLCPELASSLLLPQLAGYQRAAEALLLGETFNAQKAQDIGLVNQILPAEQLLVFARERAARVAAMPASSIRVTKQLLKSGQQAAIDARITLENQHFASMLQSPEAREAFTAFLEKRKPDFQQFS